MNVTLSTCDTFYVKRRMETHTAAFHEGITLLVFSLAVVGPIPVVYLP